MHFHHLRAQAQIGMQGMEQDTFKAGHGAGHLQSEHGAGHLLSSEQSMEQDTFRAGRGAEYL